MTFKGKKRQDKEVKQMQQECREYAFFLNSLQDDYVRTSEQLIRVRNY